MCLDGVQPSRFGKLFCREILEVEGDDHIRVTVVGGGRHVPVVYVREHDRIVQFRCCGNEIIRSDIADGREVSFRPYWIFAQIIDERPSGFAEHLVGELRIEHVMVGEGEQHVCQPCVREDVRVEEGYDHDAVSPQLKRAVYAL